MPARRTSNEMKVIRGTDRPDRMRDEPDYPTVDGYPEPPYSLRGPIAVKEWDDKIRLLSDAGVLTEAALTTLNAYCNMVADVFQAWEAGAKPTAADLTQLRLMATEFGFTPASRSKAGGSSKTNDGNPFGDLEKTG